MDGAGARGDMGAQMINRPNNGADAARRGIALTPKVVAEVEELQGRIVELESGKGRRARQELRTAREAERDLLRVLGFDSYGQFAVVAAAFPEAPNIPAAAPEVVTRAAPPDEALALDAELTEAELLNVLRNRIGDEPLLVEPGREHEFDETVEMRARIAALEAELVRAAFELEETRAGPATPKASDEVVDAPGLGGVDETVATALLQATQELRALGELLRDERAEIAALGARARAAADEILEEARLDAQRLRDDAATEARAGLEQAHAAAIALTRNAIDTVDGMRRLAAEDDAAGRER
jgi:hypothetical protein